MQVAVAHKGKRAYRCFVEGLAGHSALTHLGVNAVEFAAELATFLRWAAQDLSSYGQLDVRFEPPYSTIHIGKLNGGIALDVIPDHAELDFEIRNLPGDDPDRIMRAVHSYAECEIVAPMQKVAQGLASSGRSWLTIRRSPRSRVRRGCVI